MIIVQPVYASTVLFESDGSSLEPFPCHYLSSGNYPTINNSDGNPAPSIQFDASSNEVATYFIGPYTLPSLSYGQVLQGSQNIKITGITNYIEIAGFGMSINDECNYDPYNGPADGRFPLPSLYYNSEDKQISVYYRNSSQQLETISKTYDLSLNVWHQIDFTFTPSIDQSSYDFELKIDGNNVISGKSYEQIFTNDSLGVIIGAVGSYRATKVQYDNIKVERIDCPSEKVLNDSAMANGNYALTGLRAFRDNFLSKGDSGKSFISQYYQHSAEGIRLMMEHPEWITRSAGLLEKIQPALLNAADTGALQLDESILQEIMSLMDEVKPYTSPELSQFIDTVQSRLLKRQAMTPQDE
jgi:hypothetical protein